MPRNSVALLLLLVKYLLIRVNFTREIDSCSFLQSARAGISGPTQLHEINGTPSPIETSVALGEGRLHHSMP
jgi:hypothetical protein